MNKEIIKEIIKDARQKYGTKILGLETIIKGQEMMIKGFQEEINDKKEQIKQKLKQLKGIDKSVQIEIDKILDDTQD
jgi:hypothetical protein